MSRTHRTGLVLALAVGLVLSACSSTDVAPSSRDADPVPTADAVGATGSQEPPSDPTSAPTTPPAPSDSAPTDAGTGHDAADEDPADEDPGDDAAATARLVAQAEREQALREAEEARIRAETTRAQEVLAAHGYYAGPIDGEAGPATTSGVMAFQKVHDLGRDGVVGPHTLAALESPSPPPLAGGAPTRIEIDLDRQVVHLVLDGDRVRTMNASSGNGEAYTWPDGRRALADTPVGTFTIQRRISGLREGDLGAMYDPLYFHEGWAIHGSNSVPPYPASHGCVRLSRSDALWLAAQVPNGTQVVVHGSVNAFDPRTETVWL